MNNPEMCYVQVMSVSCQGSRELYDHPLVYLQIDEKIKKVACPYCGKVFIFKQKV